MITIVGLCEINVVEPCWVDGKKFDIRIVDLEFGIAEDICLVEYEEENNSDCFEPNCMHEEALLVDSIVNLLKEDWVEVKKSDIPLK